MKLYVLIQSADYSTDGYYQDSIKGIYQEESSAEQALEELNTKYGSTQDHCGIDVRYRINTHDLIQRPSH